MILKVPGPVLSPSIGLTPALDSVPWGNPYPACPFQVPPSADKAIHEYAIDGHRCQWASWQHPGPGTARPGATRARRMALAVHPDNLASSPMYM